MLFYYYIFIGILSTALATKNVTDAKDKRQAGHTAVVPIGHNGGPQALVIHQNQRHQPAAQYVAKSIANHGNQQQHAEQQEQEIPPEYYNLIHQQPQAAHQQEQQYSHEQQQTGGGVEQPQYGFLAQPQPTSNNHQPQPQQRVLTEEEYLELVKKTEAANAELSKKYSFNPQQIVHQQPQPVQSEQPIVSQHAAAPKLIIGQPQPKSIGPPQSYRNTYINPLGEFSLEKELAKLEESNKAIHHHGQNVDQSLEQDVKSQKYAFKPSQQLSATKEVAPQKPQQQQHQYSFSAPDYSQFAGSNYAQPAEKLVSNSEYSRNREENKYVQQQQPHQEYKIQYINQPTESPNKYLPEAEQKVRTVASLPKYQYFLAAEQQQHEQQLQKQQQQLYSQYAQQQQQQVKHTPQPAQPKPTATVHQPQAVKPNSVKIVNAPQFQYDKSQQQQPQQQHLYKPVQNKPQAHRQQQPQPAQSQPKLQHHTPEAPPPSHSTIFVSQGTGLHQHQQQQQSAAPAKSEKPRIQLPPPDSKRPLTQAEFQALVDAGYNVQAIPVPVPVPISADAYAQQLSQQQQQQEYQQSYQHHHQPQYAQQQNPSTGHPQILHQAHYQQQQQHHPHHRLAQPQPQQQHLQQAQQQQHLQQAQQQQAQQQLALQHQQASPSPSSASSGHRPQPSTKHFIRYQPQASASTHQEEGIFTSYLRPFIEQYQSLMGSGKPAA